MMVEGVERLTLVMHTKQKLAAPIIAPLYHFSFYRSQVLLHRPLKK